MLKVTHPNVNYSYSYDAAHRLTSVTDNRQSGDVPQSAQYGFTGREPDETGLVYYRARHYVTEFGRFISRDPAGLQGGINAYAYCGNNPTNCTDPSGLMPQSALSSFVDSSYFGMSPPSTGGFGNGSLSGSAPSNAPTTSTVAQVGLTLDNLLTGGYGQLSQQAYNNGNYLSATVYGLAGAAFGAINIATLGEAGAAAKFITANDIRMINRGLGGTTELTGTAETVIPNMSYREGAGAQAATAIRDIAGRHWFDDANKRTAQAVAERILGPSVDPARIRSVINGVANGVNRGVEDIAKALGF